MQKRMVKTENILSATQIKAEAARLGFTTAVIPPLRKPVHVEGLQLVESNTLSDALDALGVRK
jgi:predicted ATP-dependent serine protease